MTPAEAAKLIGCSTRQVRVLCQRKVIKARRRKWPGGYYWVVDANSALDYAITPQTAGYPRGKKREKNNG